MMGWLKKISGDGDFHAPLGKYTKAAQQAFNNVPTRTPPSPDTHVVYALPEGAGRVETYHDRYRMQDNVYLPKKLIEQIKLSLVDEVMDMIEEAKK